MGYTTEFEGIFQLNQPLFDMQVLYLLEFSRTRRFKRDAAVLQNAPNPGRIAVGLPLGEDACYFTNEKWDEDNGRLSIVDYNRPPVGQPGLWCQWVPTANGRGIEWDGNEKFYNYIEWLQYLIENFLHPWNYQLTGEVRWEGEDRRDRGKIIVESNKIICPEGADSWLKVKISPVRVPPAVFQGIMAVKKGDFEFISFLGAARKAAEMGYSETAAWIEENIETYVRGLERGFESE